MAHLLWLKLSMKGWAFGLSRLRWRKSALTGPPILLSRRRAVLLSSAASSYAFSQTRWAPGWDNSSDFGVVGWRGPRSGDLDWWSSFSLICEEPLDPQWVPVWFSPIRLEPVKHGDSRDCWGTAWQEPCRWVFIWDYLKDGCLLLIVAVA